MQEDTVSLKIGQKDVEVQLTSATSADHFRHSLDAYQEPYSDTVTPRPERLAKQTGHAEHVPEPAPAL